MSAGRSEDEDWYQRYRAAQDDGVGADAAQDVAEVDDAVAHEEAQDAAAEVEEAVAQEEAAPEVPEEEYDRNDIRRFFS